MKIKFLKISNILSFAYSENIEDATNIMFEDGLNILIGQNGAGKSTALEVINFIFKRVMFPQYLRNQDSYLQRETALPHIIKNIIYKGSNQTTYSGFRLEPHWDFQEEKQSIRIAVVLDEIDLRNIEIIHEHEPNFRRIMNAYSSENLPELNFDIIGKEIVFDIDLNRTNKTFKSISNPALNDFGAIYLTKYSLFKELIDFNNMENPSKKISPLLESFALIGSYRNYHSFSEGISLSNQTADLQIQTIKESENNRSTNGSEQSEPAVFNLVRLMIADIHFSNFGDAQLGDEAEKKANNQPFLNKINSKLSLIGLKAQVSLLNKRTWQYSFSFIDIKRQRKLVDINSLSAGQKAIIHLLFEAYGRGELKGGVIIIDEPEIHLHYQFQNEYLKIIEEINKEQNCQYILVTHSESLINSQTIAKVRRFSINERGHSSVSSPKILEDQRALVKILDNTRSIYAFFAKKVVLVEGDSDRYLFKAIFQELYPEFNQEIAVLDIGGKGNFEKWRQFFKSFGLNVYYICDFDNVMSVDFPEGKLITKEEASVVRESIKADKLNSLSTQQITDFSRAFASLEADPQKLTRPNVTLWKPVIDKYIQLASVSNIEVVRQLKEKHTDIEERISEKYIERIYILKAGAIEEYVGGAHADLNNVFKFCEDHLKSWLNTSESDEIRSIIKSIALDLE